MKIFAWFEEWRDKIIEGITEPIKKAIEDIQQWIAEKIMDGLYNLIEKVEPETIELVKENIDEILKIPDLPDGLRLMLERAKTGKRAGFLMGLASGSAMSVIGMGMSPMQVLLKPATYGLNKAITPEILPVDALITLHYRKEIEDDFFYSEMAKWGFDRAQTDRLAKG